MNGNPFLFSNLERGALSSPLSRLKTFNFIINTGIRSLFIFPIISMTPGSGGTRPVRTSNLPLVEVGPLQMLHHQAELRDCLEVGLVADNEGEVDESRNPSLPARMLSLGDFQNFFLLGKIFTFIIYYNISYWIFYDFTRDVFFFSIILMVPRVILFSSGLSVDKIPPANPSPILDN